MKRSVVSERRPWRSIQMSCGPLTMISEIAVVGEEPLERAVAEDVVGDLAGEPVAVVAREPVSWRELLRDLRLDPLAHGVGVGDVEEPRAELADDREVDAVLELGEWIAAVPSRSRRTRRGQSLVQLHRQLLLLRSRRGGPAPPRASPAREPSR